MLKADRVSNNHTGFFFFFYISWDFKTTWKIQKSSIFLNFIFVLSFSKTKQNKTNPTYHCEMKSFSSGSLKKNSLFVLKAVYRKF